MGGANNICSDKTGTLTKNMMTVKEIWQGEVRSIQPEDKQYVLSNLIPNEKVAKLFLEACACNTSGTSEVAGATEKAILQMLDKLGCNYQKLRDQHCQDPLVRFQFTSKRKKMSTVLTCIDNNMYAYDKRLHVKGAAEMILANCSHYINSGGEMIEMSDEMKDYLIKNVIEEFAKGALRTICLAYKDLRPNEGGITHEDEAEDGVNKIVEKNGLI